jgi:hypothetical protein
MVTLSPPVPHVEPSDYAVLWRVLFILAVVACALEVGWYSLQSHAGSGSAWYAAPENVLRFSVLLFVGFFAWRPLSYLAPGALSHRMASSEDTWLLAFVAAYATYLALIIGRAYFTDMRSPFDTVIYCAFAAIVPMILAASAYRRHARLFGHKAWRILRRAGVVYFWLIFAVSGLGHFYGPNRPDSYFALSLVALTGALLLHVIAALVRSVRGIARKQAPAY